jgi:hypothetical protein
VAAGGEYDEDFRNAGGASCFICCKGEGEYPQEIEVVKTGANSGTYILSRLLGIGAQPGDYQTFQYADGAGFTVIVYHGLCSRQTPFGFQPEVPGTNFGECDECHKKCRTMVLVTGDGLLGDASCAACDSTPQCSPAAGTYATVQIL